MLHTKRNRNIPSVKSSSAVKLRTLKLMTHLSTSFRMHSRYGNESRSSQSGSFPVPTTLSISSWAFSSTFGCSVIARTKVRITLTIYCGGERRRYLAECSITYRLRASCAYKEKRNKHREIARSVDPYRHKGCQTHPLYLCCLLLTDSRREYALPTGSLQTTTFAHRHSPEKRSRNGMPKQ